MCQRFVHIKCIVGGAVKHSFRCHFDKRNHRKFSPGRKTLVRWHSFGCTDLLKGQCGAENKILGPILTPQNRRLQVTVSESPSLFRCSCNPHASLDAKQALARSNNFTTRHTLVDRLCSHTPPPRPTPPVGFPDPSFPPHTHTQRLVQGVCGRTAVHHGGEGVDWGRRCPTLPPVRLSGVLIPHHFAA